MKPCRLFLKRADPPRNARNGIGGLSPSMPSLPALALLALASGASSLSSSRAVVQRSLSPPALAQLPLLKLRGGASVAQTSTHLHASKLSSVSNVVSEWWTSNKVLLIALAGSLALMSPALMALPFKAAFTGAVLIVALVQMALDGKPEQILLEAAVALVVAGVISLKDAFAGFSSEGVVSVGVMCAVAKGVQTTGGLELIARVLLGSPSSYTVALVRMLMATMGISAFMNNTPVCAMMMPILAQWTSSLGLAPSGMLMPLSFATMLGGTITLIGSSTNLVARTAAMKQDPSFSMGVFDITAVGLINAAAGMFYMVMFAPQLLPGAGGSVHKTAVDEVSISWRVPMLGAQPHLCSPAHARDDFCCSPRRRP